MMSTLPCPGTKPGGVPREITAASDIYGLPEQWELKEEGRPLFGSAFHTNLAGMLLNNAVGHREAKTGAPPLAVLWSGLGCKERIVNALDVFLRDAAASVRDLNADAVAVIRRDSQRSTAWHRVLGVQEQIQVHLLQAARVSLDGRQMRRQLILYVNFRRLELVLEQIQRVEDDLVHIDFGELGSAGAREVQQVVDDLRSAERLARNLVEQRTFLVIALKLF